MWPGADVGGALSINSTATFKACKKNVCVSKNGALSYLEKQNFRFRRLSIAHMDYFVLFFQTFPLVSKFEKSKLI